MRCWNVIAGCWSLVRPIIPTSFFLIARELKHLSLQAERVEVPPPLAGSQRNFKLGRAPKNRGRRAWNRVLETGAAAAEIRSGNRPAKSSEVRLLAPAKAIW